MKFKVILISIGLVASMLSGVGLNYYNKANDAEVIANVSKDEIVAEDNETTEENTVQEKSIENNVVEDVKQDKIESEVIAKEPVKTEEKSKPKSNSSTTTITTTQKQNTQEKKQSNIPASSQVTRETPKVEEKKNTNQTQSDLGYWCVSGGSHHVAGDGANEHGYYSSWNQANQAFESYTSGWASVQYKISQCPCGLYYFWATK